MQMKRLRLSYCSVLAWQIHANDKTRSCARIIKISKYYQTFNRCFFSQVTTVTELSVTSDTGQCRPGQARSGQAGRAEQQPSLALLCSLFLGTELWLPGSSVLVSYGRTIRPRGSWFNPGHGILSLLSLCSEFAYQLH